jgi:hypothetical protein
MLTTVVTLSMDASPPSAGRDPFCRQMATGDGLRVRYYARCEELCLARIWFATSKVQPHQLYSR